VAKRFVIGDVHGCYYTLKALIENQLQPSRHDHVYLLGDSIDRGPYSKTVLDYCLQLDQAGYRITMLRGNHEQMLLDALQDKRIMEIWLTRNGGWATLQSFHAHTIYDIPDHYIELISKMPYYVELQDFILVHASLNLALENPFSDIYSMLWARETPMYPEKIHFRRIVHGHTPLPLEEIRKKIENYSFTINLDGGCVLANIKGYGNLCALELNFQQLFVQHNSENIISSYNK
jgi:serine/threonine protein phosphatase 1